MQKNNKLNIPAVLMHEVNGVQYRVNGIITAINESNNTCSMKFRGYPVFNGIPMNSIYMNEAFLDKVKEYGKKAWQGIKKLVKAAGGFLFPEGEDGRPDMEYLYSPINIAIASARSKVPVTFYPADGMVAQAAEFGVNLPNAGVEAWDSMEDDDTSAIETYWSRVMKTYAKNESMNLSDAVAFVNENFYKSYNAPLNEASTLSIGNILGGQYGEELNTRQLVKRLMGNIISQMDGTPGHHSNTKPLLVWGAPGIGKTAVIKEVLKRLKERRGLDLSIEHVACGSMFRDDYVIPDTEKNLSGQKVAVDVSKLWLPVYNPPADPQVLAERDAYYNSGRFKYRTEDLKRADGSDADVHEYDGGVIFLDEFMRMPPQSQNIIMNVVNEHVYNGMILASKWGWVLASNRAFDVLDDEKSVLWEPAQSDRYTSVTFVSTRKEWLSWAREMNASTGRQNVDEMFCNFIEHSPMGVWYDALKFGSRNDKLTQDEINTLDGDDFEAMQAIQKENNIALDKVTWTPRSWTDRVNKVVMDELKNMIFGDYPELYRDCFVNGNLNMARVGANLNKLSKEEWEDWAEGDQEVIDPRGTLSRPAFFMKWVSSIIGEATGSENMPKREWDNYNNFRSTFTTQVIDNIWEEGSLGNPKLEKDDDLYFNTPGQYETTEFSKWKKNSSLADEVTALIVNGYPGGDEAATAQIKKDLKSLSADGTTLSPAEHKKLFDKYAEEYSVKIGNKKVYLLYKPAEFQQLDKKNPTLDAVQQVNLLYTLENSKFARQYANVAKYIAKFSIQMHADNKLGDMQTEFLVSWFAKHLTQPSLKSQILPMAALSGVNRDSDAEAIATSKLIGFPACTILNNAMYRDKDFAVNGSLD